MSKALGTIIGNIGSLEFKELDGDKCVINLSIAHNRKVKENGKPKEVVDWHRVVAWNGLAQIINKYCIKGSKIFVQGELIIDTWTDADGKNHRDVKLRADSVELLT